MTIQLEITNRNNNSNSEDYTFVFDRIERHPILGLRATFARPQRCSSLDLVNHDGQVTVADMVWRFSISAVTVPNDAMTSTHSLL